MLLTTNALRRAAEEQACLPPSPRKRDLPLFQKWALALLVADSRGVLPAHLQPRLKEYKAKGFDLQALCLLKGWNYRALSRRQVRQALEPLFSLVR